MKDTEAPIIEGLNEDMPEDAAVQNADDEHWSDKLNQSSDHDFNTKVDEGYDVAP